MIGSTHRTPARLVTALVVGALVLAGGPLLSPTVAAAATKTVTITSSGFVPRDTAAIIGDTVTFTNSDSAAHELDFKGGSGVTCTASPLVVQPGASQSCTFAAAGNFGYSDPNKKGNTFRGTVSVTAAPAVAGAITLAASKPLVVYGSAVRLTGKINPAKGGVSVDLYARPYPESAFTKVASVATQSDGAFSFSLPPRIRTEYRTQFVDGPTKGESATLTVAVRPKVALSVKAVRGGVATLRTGVVSSLSYAGKPILVQRRNSQGGWTTVKSVRLGQFSTLTFGVKAPSGTSRWRIYLQASVAGAGYEASFSRTRKVVR